MTDAMIAYAIKVSQVSSYAVGAVSVFIETDKALAILKAMPAPTNDESKASYAKASKDYERALRRSHNAEYNLNSHHQDLVRAYAETAYANPSELHKAHKTATIASNEYSWAEDAGYPKKVIKKASVVFREAEKNYDEVVKTFVASFSKTDPVMGDNDVSDEGYITD